MENLKTEIKNYIEENGAATIPEMQVKFDLSYSEISPAIRELCDAEEISLADEVSYKILPKKSNDEARAEREARFHEFRSMLRRWRGQDDEDDEADEDDDEDDDGADDDDDDDEDDEDDEEFSEDGTESAYECLKRRQQAIEDRRREMLARLKNNIQSFSEYRDKREKEKAEAKSAAEDNEIVFFVEKKDDGDTKEEAVAKSDGALKALNPVTKQVDTLKDVNPMQRLVNDLSAINPVSRLARAVEAIAAKNTYEQSELYNARKRLAAVLRDISLAQDDKLRNKGRSYSEDYFFSFINLVKTEKAAEGKYSIKARNVNFADGRPYEVYLVYEGNRTYLSDDGLVYSMLSRRIGDSRAKRKMENHTAQKLWLKFENGKLLMPTSIEHSVEDYFGMYYAMRSLLESF